MTDQLLRSGERSLVTRRIGSTDKAERLLGFRAEVDLSDGLQRLIEWRRQTGVDPGGRGPRTDDDEALQTT